MNGAQYWNMIREGVISEEQAKNLVASRLEIEARTQGQHISNKVARSTADSIIDATRTAKENEAALTVVTPNFLMMLAFVQVRWIVGYKIPLKLVGIEVSIMQASLLMVFLTLLVRY